MGKPITFEEHAKAVKAAYVEGYEKGYDRNHPTLPSNPEGAWVLSGAYIALLDRVDRDGHAHPWQ